MLVRVCKLKHKHVYKKKTVCLLMIKHTSFLAYCIIYYGKTMEQHTLKVWNCLNTSIYSYLETSGGQSSNPCLNVVHFFNTSVNQTSVASKDSCFPVLVSNTCCSYVVHHSKKEFDSKMFQKLHFFSILYRRKTFNKIPFFCTNLAIKMQQQQQQQQQQQHRY